MYDVDVVEARGGDLHGQLLEHERRHVDRDHPSGPGCDRLRELSGAGPEVDHRRLLGQLAREQHRDLVGRVRVLLDVVAPHVLGVEVLPAHGQKLVGDPRLRPVTIPPACHAAGATPPGVGVEASWSTTGGNGRLT